MADENKCILCGRECSTDGDFSSDVADYNCPACGYFSITRRARVDYLERMPQSDKHRIAACTRERNIRELPPLRLCSGESAQNPSEGVFAVEYVLGTMFPSRIQDRFDRALGNLCRLTPSPGMPVTLQQKDKMPVVFAETEQTSSFIISELENMKYISTAPGGAGMSGPNRSVTVTAAGIARMQQLEEPEGREASKQAFVAMWFDPGLEVLYFKGIEPAVKRCGYNPLRIDAKQTNQKVCDEIIAEIRRSRFVIADFTGNRGGVYFEAGFAMGLGIPVIWTCKNLKAEIDALHFDTRQYSHVLWDSPEDLNKKLADRIGATIISTKPVLR